VRLKHALKKFPFLKRLDLPDLTISKLANNLVMTLKGSEEIYVTPLGKNNSPLDLIKTLDGIFDENLHLVNSTLVDLELSNRKKYGPRSQSVPWELRKDSLKQSFTSQVKDFVAILKLPFGKNTLAPVSVEVAATKMKGSSSSGLPFLVKKSKAIKTLLSDLDTYLERKDPCVLYTRTAENKKTRNVWGYPFALTLLEMMFYTSFIEIEKTFYYRASIISPTLVAIRITEIIDLAIATGRVIYSVDFAAFDSSIRWQFIALAFEHIKSYFRVEFGKYVDYISLMTYSISIVTPNGIWRHFHGVPSGAGFTNCIDSLIQFGRAALCDFISALECQVQGDDGVYIMKEEQIPEFINTFTSVGMKLETSKSHVSKDYAIFCQNLYHSDYRSDDGIIYPIYPLYRALNRLVFQERFVDFKKIGISARSYYGIRTLTILENCRFHPMFREFVKFVMIHEQNSLEVSQDSLVKYCEYLNLTESSTTALNHQYGSNVLGIRDFASYKVARELMSEMDLYVSATEEEIL